MFFGKRKGYLAYPVLASAILLASISAHAQDTPPQQPQAQPQSQTQPDQSQPPAQSQPDQAQPSDQRAPQHRAQVLREAQQRVRARRRLRVQQIIQDTYSHKYETYFGGGYLRFRPGSALQKNSEYDWNVGITDYLAGKLGITADFRGYYGTTFTNINQFQVFAPSISQYTFMAGPQYRFFAGQHWAWSAFTLAGVGHGNFGTGTGGLPATLIGLYPDGNALNITAGVSLDYNLGPALAVRLTPNYLMSRYGGETQNNLGFNAGLVYRFGRQKK